MKLTHTKKELDEALADIYTATRNHSKDGAEAISLLAYCLVLTTLTVKKPEINYDFVKSDLLETVEFIFNASTKQESLDRPHG